MKVTEWDDNVLPKIGYVAVKGVNSPIFFIHCTDFFQEYLHSAVALAEEWVAYNCENQLLAWHIIGAGLGCVPNDAMEIINNLEMYRLCGDCRTLNLN